MTEDDMNLKQKSPEKINQEFEEKLKQIPEKETTFETDDFADKIEIVEEVEETLEQSIPFMMIEDLPVYPGCKGRKAELKSCFTKMVGKHVSTKFNFNLLNELGLDAGRKKVLIAFKINNKGNVVNMKVKKVPHPRIEKEVVRVMKMLPTMKPGRQRGRAIGVSYNFPLIFIVEEKSKKNN